MTSFDPEVTDTDALLLTAHLRSSHHHPHLSHFRLIEIVSMNIAGTYQERLKETIGKIFVTLR